MGQLAKTLGFKKIKKNKKIKKIKIIIIIKKLGLCCQYVTLFSQEVLKGWFPKAPGTKSLADKQFFPSKYEQIAFCICPVKYRPEIRVSLKTKRSKIHRFMPCSIQCYVVLTSTFVDSRAMELHKNVSIQCLCVATFKQR